MPKSHVGVHEGDDKNIATYSFVESSVTKHMERTVLSAPDITMVTSPSTEEISEVSLYPTTEYTLISTTLSGSFNNFNSANCVDSNLSTKGWDTNGDSVGDKFVISLSSSVGLVKFGVYVNSANYDGKYDIKYSDDNSTWNTVIEDWTPTTSGWNYTHWVYSGKHKYWTLELSSTSSSVHGDFMEIKVYSPDYIAVNNDGNIIIKPLFSGSNTSCNVRVVFYDGDKNILGISDEVSLYSTELMENNKYIGSLLALGNTEVGASYIGIAVTSITNGTVEFYVTGG